MLLRVSNVLTLMSKKVKENDIILQWACNFRCCLLESDHIFRDPGHEISICNRSRALSKEVGLVVWIRLVGLI